jgi:WD40 repeat protein
MRYKAFISYSHGADGKLAPAIQSALHRIGKPWYRLRSMRVFRDQTNLTTSPGLWTSIESALREAEFFVYLASPAAAQSPWVQKEVTWWLKNRSYRTFLIMLTDGEIEWDNANQDLDWTRTTAIPRELSKAFSEEPLYTDVRWARTVDQLSLRHAQFRAAILVVGATLLNRAKDELDGEDVRQHRRTKRVAGSAVMVLVVLFVAALLAAYFATQQSMLATARALSAQSEAVLPTDPELALLLSREALRFRTDDQAEHALRQAFIRNPQRMIHHGPAGPSLVATFVGSNAVIAGETGKQATVWDFVTGRRVTDLPGEVAYDRRPVQFTDHPVVIIPAADDGSFTLYDGKTWKSLASRPGRNARISRDGKILTAIEGDRVRQWSLPSLEELNANASVPEALYIRDVSFDGTLLLLTSDQEVSEGLVVEARSGQTLARIPRRVFREGGGFSPDGRFLIAEGFNNLILELWDAHNGGIVRVLSETEDIGWTTTAAFSPDSKKFITGNRNGSVQGWNLDTGERIYFLNSQRNDIFKLEFSPDGKSILSVAADGTALLWDSTTLRAVVSLGGKGDEAFDIAFASDSRHFLTTHTDGTIRVWDREVWQPAQSFRLANTVLSNDGHFVVGKMEQGSVVLWDTTNDKLRTTFEASPTEIQSIALSVPASLAAIAPVEGVVGLWNTNTGVRSLQFAPASAETTVVAFDPTGTQLATGGKQGTIRFWSTSDGKLLSEWRGNEEEEVRSLVFHPDGERIVATSGNSFQVRERKSGTVLLQAELDEGGYVQAVALNADGSLLMTMGDLLPQIWDLKSYKRLQTLEGHGDDVFSGAFARDGRWLLTGSGYMRARGEAPDDGNAVFLWDSKTGRRLLSYLSAERPVETVTITNDGKTILAGSADGWLRRYNCEACLPLPALIELVSSRTARELSVDERARYLPQDTLLARLINRLARN